MDRRYEEYRDSNDMTDAEALRNLIRQGLNQATTADDLMLSMASNLATITIVIALLATAGAISASAAWIVGGLSLAFAAALMVEVHFRPVRGLRGGDAAPNGVSE